MTSLYTFKWAFMRSSSLAWSEVLSLNLASWAECLVDVRSLVHRCMWQKECYSFFFSRVLPLRSRHTVWRSRLPTCGRTFFCSTIKISWLCDRVASGINRLHNEIWTEDNTLPIPWRFPSWVTYLVMSQSHLRVTLKQTGWRMFSRTKMIFLPQTQSASGRFR